MVSSRLFVVAIGWIAILAAMPAARGGAPAAPAPATASLDQAIERSWRDAKVTPAPLAGDHEYMRRVTLDLAGRLPEVGEIDAFVADQRPDKRARLVDRLLSSDDYAAHWADVYLDLMVGREARFRPQLAAAADYFEQAFASNRPMDRVATELITATGSLDDNGATALIAAQRFNNGSVENIAGKTARVFLGAQIQCAQCHDHPYDERIKKDDFRDFAAYFGGVRLRRVHDPILGDSAVLFDAPRVPYAPRQKLLDHLSKNPYLVEPRFFGVDTPPRPGESRRDVLARAIVASPAFARVTVNRTWGLLFGRALVTPWDDLSADDSTILEWLTQDFIQHHFDHRRLLRTIALSTAYQRAAVGGAGSDVERAFARASVRPLSASQLFYAQMQATGYENALRRLKRRKISRFVERIRRAYLFTFVDDEGDDVDTFTGNVPQALLLRNGPLTNIAVRTAKGSVTTRILAASADPAQRLSWMFLATLGREPTEVEALTFLAHIERRRNAGYVDVMHALITSTEFGTNH